MANDSTENQVTKAPTVVVTGVTGFLGSHTAIQLLRQGYRVVGTLRSARRASAISDTLLAQPGTGEGTLRLVETDLLDDAGWDEAIAGATYVLHTASPFLAYVPKDENEVIRPAVEGTLRVLEAAKRHGVERVVATSSVVSIIFGSGERPYTEDDWSETETNNVTPYYRSKTLAERAAWRYAREVGLELAVINPGVILGPILEDDYGTSAQIIIRMLTGKLVGIPRIGFSLVDVRDVARAHLLAMRNPDAAGERFIIAGRWVWAEEIAATLREAMPEYAGVIPKRRVPSWLARLAAKFDPGLKSIIKELDRESPVSHDKAKRILGWTPRSERETILATAESLVALQVV